MAGGERSFVLQLHGFGGKRTESVESEDAFSKDIESVATRGLLVFLLRATERKTPRKKERLLFKSETSLACRSSHVITANRG